MYLLLYHVFGYRKAIVMYNLETAFPEKTAAERKAIAKKFYRNLVDTFIETIKMLSMSKRQFEKRCTLQTEPLKDLVAKGKTIQVHSGHQMNWEYGNWIFSKSLPIPWIGIYQPISNKAIDKIYLDFRSKYGATLVSTRDFKTRMHSFQNKQYAIGLIADQNTSPEKAQWLYFFSKPVPFISGPDKGARRNNTAVVFVNFVKKKRGYYHFECKTITEAASSFKEAELTRLYRDFLEETIQRNPDNYLWTHRRYRHDYRDELRHLWKDTRPNPLV